MPTEIRRYVRSLGLDAYIVGGAVRDELLEIDHADEDFLVPGVDQTGLRAALEPHGRVEDMEVHGQLVGVSIFSQPCNNRTITKVFPFDFREGVDLGRLVLLDEGSVVAEGTAAEVLSVPNLAAHYAASVRVVEEDGRVFVLPVRR